MAVALDSSFLIDVMRSSPPAVGLLGQLEASGETAAVPAPALYEVLAGVMVHKGKSAARRLEVALSRFPSLPLDREASLRSAELRAELSALGREKPHVDVLIAGIALRNSMTLVTRDRDFMDIASASGLNVALY